MRYRVLAPIESGNLLLFPVVRGSGKGRERPFLLSMKVSRTAAVEVTEAGKVRGLVRRRDNGPAIIANRFRGDQVNTLVLVNNSNQATAAAGGRDRYRRQAGPRHRQGPNCSAGQRSDRSVGLLH